MPSMLDGLPEKVHRGVLGDNSAATASAKWRWTCSHVADVAPEWPALLTATTTATPMLRADPSYPTVALFHVSLYAEKNSETACSRVADESVRVPPRVAHRSHPSINSLWPH